MRGHVLYSFLLWCSGKPWRTDSPRPAARIQSQPLAVMGCPHSDFRRHVCEGGSSLWGSAAQLAALRWELVALRPDLILGNSTFVDLVLTGGTGAWSTNPDSAYEAHNHFR